MNECLLGCVSRERWLLLAGAEWFEVVDGSPKHFTLIFNAFVFCQVSLSECLRLPA